MPVLDLKKISHCSGGQMVIFLFLGLIVVLIILLVGYLWLRNKTRPDDKQLGQLIPGPKPWPIIGSLHLMANFKKYPFEAFTNLQKVFDTFRNNFSQKPMLSGLWLYFSNQTWICSCCRHPQRR